MDRWEQFWGSLYRRVVLCFFVPMAALLAAMALCSTSHITLDSTTLFVADAAWQGLLAAAVVLLLLALGRRFLPAVRRIDEDDRLFRAWQRGLLILLLAAACLWVLTARVEQAADQRMLQNLAYQMASGDYAGFADSGYLGMYHNNIGFTLLVWCCSQVFGFYNYEAMQLLNCLFLVWSWHSLSELAGLYGAKNSTRLVLLTAGLLFLPLSMYVTFIYGNLPGLGFALAAFLAQQRSLRTGSLPRGILSALFITMACVCKQNYLIFLVALCLDTLVQLLRKPSVRRGVLMALLIAACVAQSVAPIAVARRVTGQPLDQGASAWSWIVMGMQKSGDLTEGWYNDYNQNSYFDSGCDTAAQAAAAKEKLKSVMEQHISRGDLGTFMLRKLAAIWNNPTFEGFWLNETRENECTASWATWMMSRNGENAFVPFLNLLQSVILLGVLLWVLLAGREERGRWLLLCMTFVGGFLFQAVWEAKSQYTLPYFVLLIPIGAQGWHLAAEGTLALADGLRAKRPALPVRSERVRVIACLAVILAAAILIACVTGTCLSGDEQLLVYDLEKESTANATENGTYTFESMAEIWLGIREDTRQLYADWEADWGEGAMLTVVNIGNETLLKVQETGEYLCVDADGRSVYARSCEASDATRWTVKNGLGGYIYITTPGENGELALTTSVESEEVWVEKLAEDNENQVWYANEMDEEDE